MKIVTVCAQGNNRSVQFASLLRYKYNADTIAVGVDKHTPETLEMLYAWSDIIIVTDKNLAGKIPEKYRSKMKIWDVGPDIYPRPFNPILNHIARKIIEENPL
jgi:predicted protein tyrosine phosphatase